jgi:hypothetical protein
MRCLLHWLSGRLDETATELSKKGTVKRGARETPAGASLYCFIDVGEQHLLASSEIKFLHLALGLSSHRNFFALERRNAWTGIDWRKMSFSRINH